MCLVLGFQIGINNFNEVVHSSPSHTFYHVWVQRFYFEVDSHPIGTQAFLNLCKNCFSLHMHWVGLLGPSSSFSLKAAITSNLSPNSQTYLPLAHLLYSVTILFLSKEFFDEVTSLIEDPCWFPMLKIEVGMGSCHLTTWDGIQVPSISFYVTLGNLFNFWEPNFPHLHNRDNTTYQQRCR